MSDTPRDPAAGTPLRRQRLRPTGRAALLGGLGVLLYGAGANSAAGWVIVLAAIAIGAVPWALVTSWRASRSLVVHRTLPREVVAGVDTRVRLRVRGATSAMAVLHDELTNAVGVAAGLRDGAEVSGTARLRRGATRAGTVTVRLQDPFGLVSVVLSGEVASPVLALPAMVDLRAPHDPAPWAVEAGHESQTAGHGTEVIGAREYRHGDAIRTVHWRSTARRGQLVVRELAEPSRPAVRVEIGPGTWDRGALDQATEVAAGIAEDAHTRGHPTTLAADGQQMPWTPDARRHLALLPPHAGAEPRPLAASPGGTGEVVVALAAGAEGPRLTVTRDDRRRDLGEVPAGIHGEELAAWLRARLANGRRQAVPR